MGKKPIALAAMAIFLSCAAFSGGLVSMETWRILEDGKIAFERGENGEALALCEKARVAHSALIARYAAVLEKSLLPREVKKAGDDIDAVREVLAKRGEDDALGIIDKALEIRTKESFGKSMKALIEWIKSNGFYPESNLLAGQIYEADGEQKLALLQYEDAWNHKELFDIPDARYELAYRMSDLSFNVGDYSVCEKYLLLVIENDPLFGKPGEESPSLKAMMRTLREEKTVDKFFLLYRHPNYRGLKAYQDLSDFYYIRSNRVDRAFPTATLAAVISVTRMSEILHEKDFEYSYTTFPDLVVRFGKSPELSQWASENKVWLSFTMLARIMQEEGLRDQALSLWSTLANNCADPVTVRMARTAMSKGKK